MSQISSVDLTAGEQESLIELSCDETLKASFKAYIVGPLDKAVQCASQQGHALSASFCNHLSV